MTTIIGMISPETIQAIAGLWKLVAAVAVLLAIILFCKPLKKKISGLRIFKYKKGETEVSVESAPEAEAVALQESSDEVKQEPEKPKKIAEQIPRERGEFLLKMQNAFDSESFDDAEAAYQELQESETDKVMKLNNEVIYLYLLYQHGRDSAAISKMEKLSENEEVKIFALYYIASCYEYSRNYPKAIEIYRSAPASQLKEEERVPYAISLADCLSKIGQGGEALKELSAGLMKVTSSEDKAKLYQAIADIYQSEGNSTLQAIALQKVLQFKSEDARAFFSAAYAQSAAKISPLSATNYHTLLRFNPKNSTALNNLGVECEILNLPLKCVGYFKEAADEKSTLAMANLGYRYMAEGFEEEAEQILKQALKQDKPHRNVGEAMASLADRNEKENKEWDIIVAHGLKQQDFFWNYAEAYFESFNGHLSFIGSWISADGQAFEVIVEGEKIVGKWETEKHGERIEGTVHNRAALVKYQRKGQGLGLISPPYWETAKEGFAYLTKDGRAIKIHMVEKNEVIFLTFVRKGHE